MHRLLYGIIGAAVLTAVVVLVTQTMNILVICGIFFLWMPVTCFIASRIFPPPPTKIGNHKIRTNLSPFSGTIEGADYGLRGLVIQYRNAAFSPSIEYFYEGKDIIGAIIDFGDGLIKYFGDITPKNISYTLHLKITSPSGTKLIHWK